MRTVFFGTPETAVPSLLALQQSPHAALAVICRPDLPAGRGRRPAAPPVKQAALELGLPVLQPESVATAAFRRELGRLEPDLLVVVAYGRILGPKLLAVAPRGALNVHFSLLPRWRGAAPVQRALLAGDEVTGVSVIRLVQELDAGPIYASERLGVAPGEHAPSLRERLAELGARILPKVLTDIERDGLEPVPQPADGVTLAPPLSRDEGRLDPDRPAEELERRVRALDPWPGTRLRLGDEDVAVLEARASDEVVELEPGRLLAPRAGALPMACGGGSVLEIRMVRRPGRRAMSARGLVDGRLVAAGERAGLPAT